jgi:uncharacterized protein YjdB
MLVVFANNQTLIAASGTTVTITTDPVAVGDNNQASGITNIHAMFNDDTQALTWQMQVSNDGVNWVNQGPAAPGLDTVGTPLLTGPQPVSCVYARLQIAFSATGGTGATVFDIHVNFDRA